jgi:3D (Asp-Asp-Asp) domain-containing protein
MRIIIRTLFCIFMIMPASVSKFDGKKFEIDEAEEIVVKKQKPLIVTVTTYTVNESETDSSPTITASGFEVSRTNPKKHRVIAVSRDLKKKLRFGDKVRVTGIGKLSGIYVVRDLMNSRWRKKIDILINPKDKQTKFHKVKMYIL